MYIRNSVFVLKEESEIEVGHFIVIPCTRHYNVFSRVQHQSTDHLSVVNKTSTGLHTSICVKELFLHRCDISFVELQSNVVLKTMSCSVLSSCIEAQWLFKSTFFKFNCHQVLIIYILSWYILAYMYIS